MPQLDSYLFFDGNCAEAMRFYARVLGGELDKMMTYAEGPPGAQCGEGGAPQGGEATAAAADRIMHASLSLGGRLLMGSDLPPGQAASGMHGFALSLNYPAVDEARRVFDALAEGGSVTMPLDKTFWAEAFGMLTDRFGTPWMVGGGAST
jgi:PhnB protein